MPLTFTVLNRSSSLTTLYTPFGAKALPRRWWSSVFSFLCNWSGLSAELIDRKSEMNPILHGGQLCYTYTQLIGFWTHMASIRGVLDDDLKLCTTFLRTWSRKL